MNLTELGLNRFLYKDISNQGADNSLFSSNVSQSSGNTGSGSSNAPATSIAPGTIIQTSPSQNRVEMNPDDTLRAYNNGQVVVQIDRNGISTFGQPQPGIYTGNVSAAGTISNGPPGWTCAFIAPSGTYTITHNLGLASPYFRVFVEPRNSSFMITSVTQVNGNSFDVICRDDAGGVTGGDFTFQALRF